MQRAFAYFAAFTGMGALFAGVLLLAAVIVGPGPASGSSASRSPGSSVAAGPIGTIEVHAFDLGFKPAKLEVPAAGHYTVKLINTGSTTHDITFASGEQAVAKAGETASVDVDIPAAGVSFLCSIPGHADAGMKGDVVIAGTAVASPSAKPDDHGGPAPATDVQADPNAPAPVRYDPTAPKLLAGSVHDIDLVMTEVDMTVATGFVQHVWTFGGTVPGPAIRVKVGDKIRVEVTDIDNRGKISLIPVQEEAAGDSAPADAPAEDKAEPAEVSS
jgi:nitrite reductase (NO-forming)